MDSRRHNADINVIAFLSRQLYFSGEDGSTCGKKIAGINIFHFVTSTHKLLILFIPLLKVRFTWTLDLARGEISLWASTPTITAKRLPTTHSATTS